MWVGGVGVGGMWRCDWDEDREIVRGCKCVLEGVVSKNERKITHKENEITMAIRTFVSPFLEVVHG